MPTWTAFATMSTHVWESLTPVTCAMDRVRFTIAAVQTSLKEIAIVTGTVLDALGECGGLCEADVDADGICDNVEVPGCTFSFACNYNPEATTDDGSCEFICTGCTSAEACNYDSFALQDDGSCLYPDDLGWCDCEGNVLDDCSVCGGDGIPAGECDCNGNQLDALGECGGSCQADADADGICDDVDPCVGEIDACGVCNGPGAVYECGCLDIPEGDCDCDGNILDECGICGGEGIPAGDCDCDGNILDECGVCGGDGLPVGACNCSGEVLDACGVCGGDDSSCAGCTYELACNYDPDATILDASL